MGEILQNKTRSVFSFFDLFQQGTGSFFAGFFTTSPFHSQDKTKDVISIMNRLESKTSCASELGANVPETFEHLLKSEPELATAVAAIKTLLIVLEKCNAKTLQELIKLLKEAVDQMKKEVDCSACSVQSGCELFLRFITLASKLEEETFEAMRSKMLAKGNIFLEKMMTAREKIAKKGAERLPDGARILVHSRSRTVFATLKEAHQMKKRLSVYVTECASNDSGRLMKRDLDSIGIPCTLVLDASVGYILEQVDLVMFGAEGVVESGGIVNKIGTYTIAICAKMLNKPVYVLCESFKFVRMYPLNQKDLKDEFKYHASTLRKVKNDLSNCHPRVDYTNPSLITLLFTDLGILTPSAVSDELIQLYL